MLLAVAAAFSNVLKELSFGDENGDPVIADIPSTDGYMDIQTYMNTLMAAGDVE